MRAYVFPGQGSQSVGMLADVAAEYSAVGETFKEASEVLGYDLWQLVQEGPAERLNETQRTQPALLTASVALYRALEQAGVTPPRWLAGHSLGEYSALVCSGCLDFKEAVALVAKRGEFMQNAVPSGVGAMAAVIGLEDGLVEEACAAAADDQVVSAVNYNSPGQVVIAGHAEAVERAGEACKERGAKRVLPLPVSVPSHCALMRPAADQLAVALGKVTLTTPNIPVVNNVDVEVEREADAIRHALIRQLYSPVRWTETVRYLADQGVTEIYEIGPGKVLTGLNKRIDKSLQGDAVNSVDAIKARI
ncbi:ACP S-malonyltransferase [Pseudidiomarina terrestris]|uniref:Malonyl CoA-acyl carrier protein transacylase n=1 Tax=Pseudidiomarina terrestris TaxID=2820060 RepID=A0AAW7QW40_9GAMM|nr:MULTISPECIES: ACP S-malonyltransferase [unclassified Pseudidiomarina]MDN7123636.1 ACP S-malonyltransferase [Pseudidiomarina sp. 1APP75-32.1]MDN7126574.1 ACP S-malonyltransferase [Pseudidiomarina sp. 1APR75-33.1]MDN7128640.1 ACP S-malonyltransferase [Pseudidiomarina sp. 1APR75-15]MDN7135101.1 ACP S-malonyltransferase [Pseudidiomarina sp. 1ASP75-5]MEA3587120.1 ACP S-malonyltransferase [Pseudidiomarina sp. 1APP75-27a]